jgi:hypothetical protein
MRSMQTLMPVARFCSLKTALPPGAWLAPPVRGADSRGQCPDETIACKKIDPGRWFVNFRSSQNQIPSQPSNS